MAGIIKAGHRTPPPPACWQAFHFDDVGSRISTACAAKPRKIVAEPARKPPESRPRPTEEGRQAAHCRPSRPRSARGSISSLTSVLAALQPGRAKDRPLAARLAAALGTARRRAGRRDRRPPLPPRAVARSREITLAWVREALELAAGNARDHRCGCIPHDHAALGDAGRNDRQATGRPGHRARSSPIAAITAGGCRVDTEFGSLDQQLEAQLARITEELLS